MTTRSRDVEKATRKMAKRAAKLARQMVEADYAARRPPRPPAVTKAAPVMPATAPADRSLLGALASLERLNPPASTRARIERLKKALADPSNP